MRESRAALSCDTKAFLSCELGLEREKRWSAILTGAGVSPGNTFEK